MTTNKNGGGWTRGPLRIESGTTYAAELVGTSPRGKRRVVARAASTHDNRERDANAARLVSCWNACESLADPSCVPELVEALRGILDWYFAVPEPGSVPDGLALTARLREARAAIAKAGVK